MNDSSAVLEQRQLEMETRLDPAWQPETEVPVMGAGNLIYQMGDKVRAIAAGGIGLVEQLVESIGLRALLDARVDLFKQHRPYHESDHILTMAYNLLCGGQTIEDIERLRTDVTFLDAVGAQRLPDPTTAGDFLRRFATEDRVAALMEAQNDARLRVWKAQPSRFRERAVIDVDGTIVSTTGKQKEGTDFAYNGAYGYGPLILSLANTNEVLYTVNRAANRPSHDGAIPWMKKAVELVTVGGFRKILLRGDTDFSLTAHFATWSAEGVQFVFGMDANREFVDRAEALEDEAWTVLKRPKKYAVKTEPRSRRRDYKDTVIRMREMKKLRLAAESWAEVLYTKKGRNYRMIVLRKNISVTRGEDKMGDEIRYRFYVTNVPAEEMSAPDVIYQSNARCNQENVIKQLKSGVQAMRMPAGDLVANWAYMAIATLAFNLKAWMGLLLPKREGGAQLTRMTFPRFVHLLILIPAQIKKGGRHLVFRLLSYTRWVQLILQGSMRLRKLNLA
jgi:Transposase DDE domain group 1